MSLAPQRLLGFAFASADLLLEIGNDDQITFAVGLASTLVGGNEQTLIGHSWRGFVDERDAPLIDALFDGMQDGARKGPIAARQASTGATPGQTFTLSAFRLPQNGGAVSCALVRSPGIPLPTGADGLQDKDAFEQVTKGLFDTAKESGIDLELAFIQLDGLMDARKSMDAKGAHALQRRLAGALRAQSHGGNAATALTDERFALVRQSGETTDALAARIAALIAADAKGANIRPLASSLALDGAHSPAQMVRAIRYALDDFIKEGVQPGSPVSLTEAVNNSLRKTLAKVDALATTVAERRFRLVYQPVVCLKTGDLHHHEVLVRFGDNASPFPTIRMAEELDLIEDLDIAIAEQTVAVLKADKSLKLAVNVSGRTIISDAFIQRMAGILKDNPELAPRLMFEITESAAIEDLGLANRHIQTLRKGGSMVCLDDFGAGAASLAYLQQLTLDVVKIDGSYVRELQHGGRESTFMRHLVHMCSELKVKTLAEMVETSSVEDAVRRAGVDFAQSWYYGAGADKPEQPLTKQVKPAARRAGAKESWG